MKGVVLDCSSNRLYAAACNGGKRYCAALDAGQYYASDIIPVIDEAFKRVDLKPEEIDFAACAEGPGSFTGLRLGFSALKALAFAASCPLYTVPTTDLWVAPLDYLSGAIIPAIDAKRARFYCAVYRGGKNVSGVKDCSCDELLRYIDPEERVTVTGPDAAGMYESLRALLPAGDVRLADNARCINIAAILLDAACVLYERGEPGIGDTDGPIYVRKSDAEEKSANV